VRGLWADEEYHYKKCDTMASYYHYASGKMTKINVSSHIFCLKVCERGGEMRDTPHSKEWDSDLLEFLVGK
jgi:hypothetical protein